MPATTPIADLFARQLSAEVARLVGHELDNISGAGLALSGGGYRAMLFHVGALGRLYGAGVRSGQPLSEPAPKLGKPIWMFCTT